MRCPSTAGEADVDAIESPSTRGGTTRREDLRDPGGVPTELEF